GGRPSLRHERRAPRRPRADRGQAPPGQAGRGHDVHRRRHGCRRDVRSRLRTLALALLLAAAPAAFAVEKCIGADGKVTYSDHGCAGAAKRSIVGVDTSLGDARIDYYDVSSPGGELAHAQWYLSYTYRPRSVAA